MFPAQPPRAFWMADDQHLSQAGLRYCVFAMKLKIRSLEMQSGIDYE